MDHYPIPDPIIFLHHERDTRFGPDFLDLQSGTHVNRSRMVILSIDESRSPLGDREQTQIVLDVAGLRALQDAIPDAIRHLEGDPLKPT